MPASWRCSCFPRIARYYLRITTEYVINDDEITEITGMWAKDENHVPIEKIEDYNIDRSLLGKFLGVANIGIQTARAERGYEIVMRAIPEKDVAALDQALDKLVNAKRQHGAICDVRLSEDAAFPRDRIFPSSQVLRSHLFIT